MAKTHKRYRRVKRHTKQTVKNSLTGGVWYKPWTWGKPNTKVQPIIPPRNAGNKQPSPPKAPPQKTQQVSEIEAETASEEEHWERMGKQPVSPQKPRTNNEEETDPYATIEELNLPPKNTQTASPIPNTKPATKNTLHRPRVSPQTQPQGIEDLYAPIGESLIERTKRHERLREKRKPEIQEKRKKRKLEKREREREKAQERERELAKQKQERKQYSPLMKIKFPPPPPSSNKPKTPINAIASPHKPSQQMYRISPQKNQSPNEPLERLPRRQTVKKPTPKSQSSPTNEVLERLPSRPTVKKSNVGDRWAAALAAAQKASSPQKTGTPTREKVKQIAKMFEGKK